MTKHQHHKSKSSSIFWFTPSCGKETILCDTKNQQELRMRLHNKTCAECKTKDRIPLNHGVVTTFHAVEQKRSVTSEQETRLIASSQQQQLFGVEKIIKTKS